MRRGLFLDRDGVINRDKGYVHRIAEFEFLPGIVPLLRDFAARGFRLIIATNQSGIGRGYFTEADFAALTRWMLDRLRDEQIEIAAIYHAPDHPERAGPRRKPGPGMLLEAIAEHGLEPKASWALGDQGRDMAAASAAGIGTRVLLDPDAAEAVLRDGAWHVADLAAVQGLLRRIEG